MRYTLGKRFDTAHRPSLPPVARAALDWNRSFGQAWIAKSNFIASRVTNHRSFLPIFHLSPSPLSSSSLASRHAFFPNANCVSLILFSCRAVHCCAYGRRPSSSTQRGGHGFLLQPATYSARSGLRRCWNRRRRSSMIFSTVSGKSFD